MVSADHPSSVKSIYDGKVVRTGQLSDGIHFVITKFGDYYIIYSGLNIPVINKGDNIKSGQTIATLAEDFEFKYTLEIVMYYKSEYLNPMKWLKYSRRA